MLKFCYFLLFVAVISAFQQKNQVEELFTTPRTPHPTTSHVTPRPTTMTPKPTTMTPKPTTMKVTPQPTTMKVTPKPTTMKVTPQPTTMKVTPKPTTMKVTPQPTTMKVTPKPTTMKVTPKPTTMKVTPKPTTMKVTPQPTKATKEVCEYFSGYHIQKFGKNFKFPSAVGTHQLARWGKKGENYVQVYLDGLNGKANKVAIKQGNDEIIVQRTSEGKHMVLVNCEEVEKALPKGLEGLQLNYKSKETLKIFFKKTHDVVSIKLIEPMWIKTNLKLSQSSIEDLTGWCQEDNKVEWNTAQVSEKQDIFSNCQVSIEETLDVQCDEEKMCIEGKSVCSESFKKVTKKYDCNHTTYTHYEQRCVKQYCANFKYMEDASIITKISVLAWEKSVKFEQDCKLTVAPTPAPTPLRTTPATTRTPTTPSTRTPTTPTTPSTRTPTTPTTPSTRTPTTPSTRTPTTPTTPSTRTPTTPTTTRTPTTPTTPRTTTRPTPVPDCDGIRGSGVCVDICGVCGGDGTSCVGCDGIPNSGKVFDQCGVCGGKCTPATTTKPGANTTVPATTTKPGSTTVPTTTKPGSTTVPTTTKPGSTTVPTTTKPGSTTVPTTTKPGSTTVPTTTKPGSTTVPTTTKPGSTTVPTTTKPGSSTTVTPNSTIPTTTNTPATTPNVETVPTRVTPTTPLPTVVPVCPRGFDTCGICGGNGTSCKNDTCLSKNDTCLAYSCLNSNCSAGLNFACVENAVLSRNATCYFLAKPSSAPIDLKHPCLRNLCLPRTCIRPQFVNTGCFNMTCMSTRGCGTSTLDIGIIAGSSAAAGAAIAALAAAYKAFLAPPVEQPVLTPDFGNNLVDNNPLFTPKNVWGDSQVYNAPNL